MILTKAFWKGALERLIKTFCQTFVAAALALGVVSGTTRLEEVDWWGVLSIAVLATVFSVVTSIGNASFTAGEQDSGVPPRH